MIHAIFGIDRLWQTLIGTSAKGRLGGFVLISQTAINPVARFNGLVYWETGLIIAQLKAIGLTIALSAVATFVIVKLVGLVTRLRVTLRQEADGLDGAQHGDTAH
jgi:Amt family ammonium transporter